MNTAVTVNPEAVVPGFRSWFLKKHAHVLSALSVIDKSKSDSDVFPVPLAKVAAFCEVNFTSYYSQEEIKEAIEFMNLKATKKPAEEGVVPPGMITLVAVCNGGGYTISTRGAKFYEALEKDEASKVVYFTPTLPSPAW